MTLSNTCNDVTERADKRGGDGPLQALGGRRAGPAQGGVRVHVHAAGHVPGPRGRVRVPAPRGGRPARPLRHQDAHAPHVRAPGAAVPHRRAAA